MNMDPKHCFYLFDKWQDWNRGYCVNQWRIQGFQRPGSCPPPPKKKTILDPPMNYSPPGWVLALLPGGPSVPRPPRWVRCGCCRGAGRAAHQCTCINGFYKKWYRTGTVVLMFIFKKNTGKQLKLIYFNAFFESRSFRPDPDLFSWVRIGTKSGSEKSRSGFVKKTH